MDSESSDDAFEEANAKKVTSKKRAVLCKKQPKSKTKRLATVESVSDSDTNVTVNKNTKRIKTNTNVGKRSSRPQWSAALSNYTEDVEIKESEESKEKNVSKSINIQTIACHQEETNTQTKTDQFRFQIKFGCLGPDWYELFGDDTNNDDKFKMSISVASN